MAKISYHNVSFQENYNSRFSHDSSLLVSFTIVQATAHYRQANGLTM